MTGEMTSTLAAIDKILMGSAFAVHAVAQIAVAAIGYLLYLHAKPDAPTDDELEEIVRQVAREHDHIHFPDEREKDDDRWTQIDIRDPHEDDEEQRDDHNADDDTDD